jgi:Ca2+-transporting ATPase
MAQQPGAVPQIHVPPFPVTTAMLVDLAHSRSRYWSFGGLERILETLRIDPECGVGSREGIRETYVTQYAIAEIRARQKQFGVNVVPEAPTMSYVEFLIKAMNDATLQILCLAGIIGIFVFFYVEGGEGIGYIEGLAVILAVCLVINLETYQNWKKEQEFQKLNKELKDRKIHVIRYGGRYTSVKKYDIVVGDVIRLRVGDILVADGAMLSGGDVTMDESAMTGEPDSIAKASYSECMERIGKVD